MKIGEVAKLSGTGIETIRFYEREGLLEPERRSSGYRQFDGASVERLNYIRRAKELGFTLAEIRELLELSFAASTCEHVRQRAEAKIADIEGRVRSLQQMRRSLGRIVKRCRVKNSTEDCPLVHKARRKSTQ
ncbi:heavy metal-responsive transcriptional regulator [Gemmata sp. SH-PL17]|uniref:heavy metal-responsive transcriptional regulator n=1 Tax=Gemmata sp. SH-PL17 TaxID=1630693 RepID=UPI00194FA5EB|nr:heavy metal-responsive transcriptional regulator [Gemmata sp. SH-PL17]